MKNILFELVITNQCNKRCKYCDLDFKNNTISNEVLDSFIDLLIKNESSNISFLINFFWWEALLEYNKIVYFIERTKNIENIRYSIWTNWILLDKDKFNYLSEYNVEIYLSIDTESLNKDFLKKYLLNYNKLIINFILNPNTIDKSYNLFKKLYHFGFRNFNIIPVFSTIRWNLKSFIKLKRLKKYILKFFGSDILFYSYFQKPTSDIQFVIDTNWNLYRDMHTHLWIIKQLSNLDNNIKYDIEKFSFIWNFNMNINFDFILNNYQYCDLIKKSWKLPKKLGFYKDFKILDSILNES